jgi:hypothetical protein
LSHKYFVKNALALPIELEPEHQGTLLDTQGRGYPDFVKERAPEQWTQEEKILYLDIAFSFLGNVGEHYSGAGIENYFEDELRRAGLVERLEQAGLLPTEQHPEKREETFRQLYMGAVLGHVFGEKILSVMQEPSSWHPWSVKDDTLSDPPTE